MYICKMTTQLQDSSVNPNIKCIVLQVEGEFNPAYKSMSYR